MRSALVVLVFAVAAVVAGWFYLRSRTDAGPGAAAPTASAPREPTTERGPAALAEPDAAGTTSERASVRAAPAAAATADRPATAAKPPAAGVSGRVVDEGGKPIEGARVLAAPASTFARWPVDADIGLRFGEEKPWSAVTDADGRFALSGVRPGAIRLAVRAAGFAALDRFDLPVPAAESHDLGELALAAGVHVAGRVVDSRGRGVAGAKLARVADSDGPIHLSFGRPWGVPLATTDAEGGFWIDTLPAGPYRLLTTSDEHPDQLTRGATSRPGERVDGLVIRLVEGLDISGRVVGLPEGLADSLTVQAWPRLSPSSGEPVDAAPGAEAAPHHESREAAVAADGSFAMRGARRGMRYQLSTLRSARDEGWWGGSLTARQDVEAGARGVELVYQPEAALAFQVVDRATGRPIEDFEVSAGAPWPTPLVDENDRTKRHHPEGKVRFERLRTGRDQRVTLRIDAVGYEAYSRDELVLAEGQELDLGVIELAPAPVLTVRVIDTVTAQPIAGARVELAAERPSDGNHEMRVRITSDGGGDQIEMADTNSGRTDEQGVARIAALQSESCRLRVRHADYAPHKSELFALRGGESAERVVALGRGGSVHAKLVDSNGMPKPGARVEHRAPDAPAEWFLSDGEVGGGLVTDAEGVAHFAHLAPGLHSFRAKSDGGSASFTTGAMQMVMLEGSEGDDDPWTDVDVTEGGEAEITVVAPRVSRVHGRVSEAGRALAGASVRLERKSGGGAPAMPRMPFGPSGPSATTAADGSYALENVREGEYELTVTHPERAMPCEFELDVRDAEQRFDVDLPLAILEGRVLDARREPVAGAEVWPELARDAREPERRAVFRAVMVTGAGAMTTIGGAPEGPRTRTDAEGRYQLRGVTADADLQVKSRAPGFQPGETDAVRVASGETKRDVDLTLAVAGKVALTVSGGDAEGERLYFVRASWAGDGERPDEHNEMTDDQGKLLLDGLKPGPWKLEVRRLGGFASGARPAPTEQQVEVRDGETVPVTIQLP